MTRIFITVLFATVFSLLGISAHEYSVGDIIEKDGVSYKVLVAYLVVDSKESPDTVKGVDKFYCSGELMAIKVDEGLKDVVIPPAVGRFKVIGLTDSLFYGHEHDRIWLPYLYFAGNGCFANLKVRSGALVVHNIDYLGEGVFDGLEGDLIFDINKKVMWGMSFKKMAEDSSFIACGPTGLVKFNTRMMEFAKSCPMYNLCYTATSKNYKAWLDKAFNSDADFQKNVLADPYARYNKRNYSTTPNAQRKKGWTISVGSSNAKGKGYPWGSLTRDYYRVAKYSVINKKKKKTVYYKDFIPVSDMTKKEGWYVKFVGDEGEVKSMLNGKIIK